MKETIAILGGIETYTSIVISIDNQLPLNSKRDLQFFKEQTDDNIVIMGRKTWETLPVRPLKNRINVIISRQESDAFLTEEEINNKDIIHLKEVNDAEHLAKIITSLKEKYDKTVYIIGGKELYEFASPIVDKWLITVNKDKSILVYEDENNVELSKSYIGFNYNLTKEDIIPLDDTVEVISITKF